MIYTEAGPDRADVPALRSDRHRPKTLPTGTGSCWENRWPTEPETDTVHSQPLTESGRGHYLKTERTRRLKVKDPTFITVHTY